MPKGKYIYYWYEYKWPPVRYDNVEALATQVLRHFDYDYSHAQVFRGTLGTSSTLSIAILNGTCFSRSSKTAVSSLNGVLLS